MLAIDTNIVVRYLTNDHPKQSPEARSIVDGNDVYVSDTVMLETEWVLRSVDGYAPADLCRGLRGFAGLERVSVESPDLLATALDQAVRGMDFADALHLGRAAGCDAFVTFDRKLIKAARAVGLSHLREP